MNLSSIVQVVIDMAERGTLVIVYWNPSALPNNVALAKPIDWCASLLMQFMALIGVQTNRSVVALWWPTQTLICIGACEPRRRPDILSPMAGVACTEYITTSLDLFSIIDRIQPRLQTQLTAIVLCLFSASAIFHQYSIGLWVSVTASRWCNLQTTRRHDSWMRIVHYFVELHWIVFADNNCIIMPNCANGWWYITQKALHHG